MAVEDTTGKEHGVENGLLLTEDLSQTKELGCLCSDEAPSGLHQFKCLPNHLRFNHFVKTGYRMNLNTKGCLKSLFYVHNESFNIYSHGIPCLSFIFLGPYVFRSRNHSELYPIVFSIHYITSIICSFLSTVYHLIMCHEKGKHLYEKLITLDMLGIWLASTFANIAFIKATFYCMQWWDTLVLPFYSFIAFIVLICSLRGKNAKERLRPFFYFGLIRIPLYGSRYVLASTGYTTAHLSTTWVYLTAEFCGFLGGIVNSSRFPERWFPERFDYFGNSHNIMHVLVIACPIVCHIGTVVDFRWIASAACRS